MCTLWEAQLLKKRRDWGRYSLPLNLIWSIILISAITTISSHHHVTIAIIVTCGCGCCCISCRGDNLASFSKLTTSPALSLMHHNVSKSLLSSQGKGHKMHSCLSIILQRSRHRDNLGKTPRLWQLQRPCRLILRQASQPPESGCEMFNININVETDRLSRTIARKPCHIERANLF